MILVLQICAVRFSTKMIWLILLRRRVQIAPCIFIANKFRIILIFNSYALFSTFSHANGHTCVRLTYLRLKLHTSQRERITYPDKTYFFEQNPEFCVSFVINLWNILTSTLSNLFFNIFLLLLIFFRIKAQLKIVGSDESTKKRKTLEPRKFSLIKNLLK